MLPIQRKAAIVEYLSREDGGSIKDLTQVLHVSEMTVRRDLKRLEATGQVTLTHGGAVLTQAYLREPATLEKESKNQAIKDQLAAYAVKQFVSEGDVLILEGGTSVSRMTGHLQRFSQLTILTNGLETLNRLRWNAGRNTVLCSGGILREPSGTFVGSVAETFFSQFHARTVFLSALGFTAESGFTDPNMLDTETKKAMIRSADQTVMLLDSSKFEQRSFMTTVTAAEVTAVITDSGISDSMIAYFKELGVPLHIL
ncbi:MAG: DeoR/GlpR family DNA-binding transcription regulator [Gorillibacterium sp.]|nr:DeoR/GlpR family DNA-binding transcription regulator [Gorillibacterium sp.]